MGKTPLVKEKENYIINSSFPLDFFPRKFLLWCLPPVPNWFNLMGNFEVRILYPKHFHQSHSCIHIKEGCVTAF